MKDVNITLNESGQFLEVRQGEALEIKPPLNIEIYGVLDSPVKWLEKRFEKIDLDEAHIVVDRDKKIISLVFNETNTYEHSMVRGQLSIHPIFEKFGINSGKYRTPLEMSELFKMNRSYFENTQTAMELVSLLKVFKAKVNKEVEQNIDLHKGDKKLIYNQVVDSNLPPTFNVELPIFKGGEKHVLELETYFNPDDLTCTLVSPQANDIIEQITDDAINSVLEQIKNITDRLPIIEI